LVHGSYYIEHTKDEILQYNNKHYSSKSAVMKAPHNLDQGELTIFWGNEVS
jgi:hypothetical protein